MPETAVYAEIPSFAEMPAPPAEQMQDEDTMKNKYLVFQLDGQHFALAIKYVIDIINVYPITRVPNCPDFILGITNLRGKVIPIMDLRMRFEKERCEYDDHTCIIVVEKQEVSVGLLVDSVAEVVTIPESKVSPPPAFSHKSDSHTRFVEGVGMTEQGVRLILDCGIVLGDNLEIDNPAES